MSRSIVAVSFFAAGVLAIQSASGQAPSADEIFVEPTRIIHQLDGEAAGDQFGWTGRKCGDVDGDGVMDFITTAPTHQQGAGKVYLYSGRTAELLFSKTGQSGENFGNSAVGAGDVDGDGTVDFLVGAPNRKEPGSAYVYSGTDGSLIHHFEGEAPGDRFGYEVSELGDIDGDGHADILVGAMAGEGAQPRSGKLIAYSGKTGESLWELTGEETGDGFGNAAAATPLGDGKFLLAVGAQNAGEGNRGRVYVYRIIDGRPQESFRIEGDENSVNLGQMFISYPGDLDQDGVPDVYASDFSDKTAAPGGGRVVVHSGATGERILAINGKQRGEGLGTSPSDAGDVDGDGIGDLVIGAWQNRQGAPSGGKVYLYSGADGSLLRTWTCRVAGDTLGFDATGIGDVDGDGLVDFLLTSAWSGIKGKQTGRVFVVAGEEYSGTPAATDEPRYPEAIQFIIDRDAELSDERNNACKTMPLHDTVRQYVDALASLDFSETPDDFGKAFESHRQAWQDSIGVLRPHAELRGEMHDLFDEIRSMGGEAKSQLESAEKKIWDTWAQVEQAMENHRVR